MDPEPTTSTSEDPITLPEPAHLRRESPETTPDDDTDSDSELEATELRHLSPEVHSTLPRLSHIISPGIPALHWYDPVGKFWRHQIRISVPHDDCRDHLANERTFLGYLRTSVALSIMGILIAQFWTLEHSLDPSDVFGYFVLSKPVAVIFQSAALCVSLLGGFRFWRQQSAMALGRVRAGGWEVNVIGGGAFLLLLMMFAVHVGIGVYDSDHPEGA